MKSSAIIVAVAAALSGCGDTREAEVDACLAEGMRANVKAETAYVRRCMSGRGYAYRPDEFCLSTFSSNVVVWSCFDKRSHFWKKWL